jgi:CheY-like chemotaxis protein
MSDKPLAFVIEDDPDMADIFSAALDTAGFTVNTLRDGQEAMARLGIAPYPALVVLDLHLPHISGVDILRDKIRATDGLAHIPVILATADDRLAMEVESEANIVLVKPISFSQLSLLAQRLRSRIP